MRMSFALLVALQAAGLAAQSPEFDVASVKINATNSGETNIFNENGVFKARNVTLHSLLETAFELGAPRVTGPAWLDSERYDVAAKPPLGTPSTDLPAMMQALLKDRFRLTIHWEKKEMTVYEMSVGKDGMKMSRFDPEHPKLPEMPKKLSGPVNMGVSTMPNLAKLLSGSAGRPVIDKTGLAGQYSYLLSYQLLSLQLESAADPAPDFLTAVQQQLGLKLEAKKAPVDILVVDHAERVPTGN